MLCGRGDSTTHYNTIHNITTRYNTLHYITIHYNTIHYNKQSHEAKYGGVGRWPPLRKGLAEAANVRRLHVLLYDFVYYSVLYYSVLYYSVMYYSVL